jgi:hypothetical protein
MEQNSDAAKEQARLELEEEQNKKKVAAKVMVKK